MSEPSDTAQNATKCVGFEDREGLLDSTTYRELGAGPMLVLREHSNFLFRKTAKLQRLGSNG